MKAKIKAMSSEAKASAWIIGSLPFLVGGMVYITSPNYLELLWTTPTGQLVMAGSAVWMGIGILVMKNIINFDI
jgi:tight adherence protein B